LRHTAPGDATPPLDLNDDDSTADPADTKLGRTAASDPHSPPDALPILDRTAPTVQTIARADASPTNAGAVHYTVTFSEAVSGVDATDFALTSSGPSGAPITCASGSGSSYTVTVNTGTGDGTLRLDLADD